MDSINNKEKLSQEDEKLLTEFLQNHVGSSYVAG